jgi:hypothetical protein
MESKFKVGEAVIIVRVLDTDDNPDTVAEWKERIGQICEVIQIKDYQTKLQGLRYSIKYKGKHLGDWREDELEEAKSHIINNILKEL